MNGGVEAFRAKLEVFRRKNIGILCRYLLHMEEHSINTENSQLFGFNLWNR